MPDPEVLEDVESDNEEEDYKEDLLRQMNVTTIHNMDVSSQSFLALPKEIQYEILSELNERRKQSSWGRMHEMPQTGSGFSGFQMQRLVNRSNVLKKRNELGQKIGAENASQMDANLFVGDVEGLKKAKAEAKRIQSSSSGQHFLYLKDLKGSQSKPDSESNEANVDLDDEIQILEPTVIKSSNRSGGTLFIKPEIISDDDEEDIYQEEILKVIQSEAATFNQPQAGPSKIVISESSSSEDDDFEEVSDSKEPISIEIMPNKPIVDDDDLFADIFQQEDSKGEPSKSIAQEEPVTVSSRVMAEKMKESEKTYLKIVSKYVEQPEEEPEKKTVEKVTIKDDGLFDELDKDTDKLISEMKMNAREERLMRIKDLDQLQAEETKSKKPLKLQDNKNASKLLDDLGAKVVDQDDYVKDIKAEFDVAYGDAVPGFSRGKTDANVIATNSEPVNVHPDLLAKLDNEEEEFSREELIQLQNQLAEEQEGLIAERGQLDRLAASITDQMYSECQDLLQLFGIPWLVAPSEAEAQCAFLDMNSLTHGTITDDSDVWAFGGQRIYKNFFNQDKHCEYFTSADVGQHFGLSRQRLIMLAMLTGSDYTDGIPEVGPVTALEILADFQDLHEFKSWWDEHHKNLSLSPGSKVREKLRKLSVPEAFPRFVQCTI